ncbi:hypothetical protein BIU99_07775 [Plantibacter sp. MMLR14_011]|nr:hypothetical protein BIU99_07775 [Plantibacter sp. MMLR14_011]
MTLEITYKRGSDPDVEPHDALVQFGAARLRADAVEGGLYLAHVETPEELQRTGIASALFARLHQEQPTVTEFWTHATSLDMDHFLRHLRSTYSSLTFHAIGDDDDLTDVGYGS